jgi:hypothetical protein
MLVLLMGGIHELWSYDRFRFHDIYIPISIMIEAFKCCRVGTRTERQECYIMRTVG